MKERDIRNSLKLKFGYCGFWGTKLLIDISTIMWVCPVSFALSSFSLSPLKAILTKHFTAAEEHAVNSLAQLLEDLTSDPARYSNDVIVTSQLWVEDGVEGGRGGFEGRGRQNKPTSLTLKSRGCTPSVYMWVLQVTIPSLVLRSKDNPHGSNLEITPIRNQPIKLNFLSNIGERLVQCV